MKNYTLEAKITVNSNKNTNTYLLKETNEMVNLFKKLLVKVLIVELF